MHNTIWRGDHHGRHSARKSLPGHQLDLYGSRPNRPRLVGAIFTVVPGAACCITGPHEKDVILGSCASKSVCAYLCGEEEILEDDADSVAVEFVTLWNLGSAGVARMINDGIRILDFTRREVAVVVDEGSRASCEAGETVPTRVVVLVL